MYSVRYIAHDFTQWEAKLYITLNWPEERNYYAKLFLLLGELKCQPDGNKKKKRKCPRGKSMRLFSGHIN